MHIENVCRINKAELGQSRLVAGLRGHEACDQSYVKSHIRVVAALIQRLRSDKNAPQPTGEGDTHTLTVCVWMLILSQQLYQFLFVVFYVHNPVSFSDTDSLCG